MDGKTDGIIEDQIVGMFTDVYQRTNTGDNFNGGFDWNTDYTMKFENQKDQELSFAFQYTKDNNDQDMSVVENPPTLPLSIEMPELSTMAITMSIPSGRLCASAYKRSQIGNRWKNGDAQNPQWLCQQLKEC